ncbi:uncharacterized protein AMSG_04191 [Thecamonas trahens ATCC 50062]|uniref:Phospholipase B-like n=1 Tax=Thecamonas trahens ATCC 50062 TaxID=461836 RepID=A0A0L0D6E6_THETB|nr:hypothetical protein AMSG_04191 [Thecamonas trahens ATCC 50062]KNC47957.1 hypothetical protein AMSG_04191 [Thecamonas trahens ATCC 50062]|eukprot:XP_013758974.1 hypothetical protein AMSG_04191 [Thecamonas trahens ATCC 50062]
MHLLRIIVLSVALAVAASASTARLGTVYCDAGGACAFKAGAADANGAAYGSWDDTIASQGWGSLKVYSNASYPDAVQMYAAGMLEGALTAERIADEYANVKYFYYQDAPVPANVTAFLADQAAWTKAQAVAHADEPYWVYAGLLMAQLDGLTAGASAVNPALDANVMLFLQATGDLLNLANALKSPADRPDFAAMTNEEVESFFYAASHCSGLFKVTPDLTDVFFGHSAWFEYAVTVRIAKFYSFPLSMTGYVGREMTFSSYAGFLESLDDFYLMSSGLVMVQTTNAIFNNDLLDLINSTSMLSWQSVRIANALATTGKQWFELDAYLNAGTYSNQYMILDTKLFTPGMPLQPNTFWVMDQIPGLSLGSDLTELLANGYYGSYNVPFHTTIWEMSGYGAMVKKTGSETYTYELAPRATIFRRNQTDVTDIESMKAIMRYNDYKHDPLSNGNSMWAICSRGDLSASPNPGGCYDSKVAHLKDLDSLSMHFISGPTRSSGLPAFKWTPEFSAMAKHVGIPEVFDFDFAHFTPKA